jgi:hypothetical protein
MCNMPCIQGLFFKKGCVLYPQMNFKSFFDRKKKLEKYFVSKHSGVGC